MKTKKILINLKRFDVSRSVGGVCDDTDPANWIENVIDQIITLNLINIPYLELSLFVPDALLKIATNKLNTYDQDSVNKLSIGVQSCHSQDVSIGGNFGAFTTFNLASTQKTLGGVANIIGHCEERRFYNQVLQDYFSELDNQSIDLTRAAKVVSNMINQKIQCALANGMQTTVCIGETSEERGVGTEQHQVENAKQILKTQLISSLAGISASDIEQNITVAYEPVWAIGPGKTPPGKEYIQDISLFIKHIVKQHFSAQVDVVYGGGLKNENAAMLASIPSLDGGLIALTNFTAPIGFQTDELAKILTTYKGAL
ncbi:triose-phosphate isomerase [Vibrio sp. MA40-2]|uniref:triose-phosphate isomerase n=1 Tax=Vibrio sp. MA40-2 TaxID=3391828 RepID=UPI0039A763DF